MKHIKLFEAYLVSAGDEILYKQISDEKDVSSIYQTHNINKKTIKRIEKYIASRRGLDQFELKVDYDDLHQEKDDIKIKFEKRHDVLFILSGKDTYKKDGQLHKDYLIKEYEDSWFSVTVSIIKVNPFEIRYRETFKCDGFAGLYQLIDKWDSFQVQDGEDEE